MTPDLRTDLVGLPIAELASLCSNNFRTVQRMLLRQLQLGDNANVAIMTRSVTSGVEDAFPNPLSGRPVGWSTWRAFDAQNKAVAIGGAQLNLARADGKLGLTVTQELNGATGDIGEYAETVVAAANKVALTNNVVADAATLALTAGDWDVDAICMFTGAPVGTYILAGIGTASATLPGAAGNGYVTLPLVPVAGIDAWLAHRRRIVLSGSGTAYMEAASGFAGAPGTVSAYGTIRARRMARVRNAFTVVGVLWGG